MRYRPYREGISKSQDRFEHELATLILQMRPEMTYTEARKILAESEGATEYAARERMYDRERSMVDRFFRWLGL